MTKTYDDLVNDLPIPTWDQSERFVRHVSNAHSWYKTPIDQSMRFFVFLDLCPTLEGENSRILGYHQLFGFWNYAHAPAHANLVDSVHGWEAPHARLPNGRKIYLSEEWRNAGCASVDAFIYPDIFPPTPVQFLTSEEYLKDEYIDFGRKCTRTRSLLEERMAHRGQRVKHILESQIPVRFRSGLKPSEVMHPDSTLKYTTSMCDWPDENWKWQLTDRQVPPAYWGPLCKYFELITHEARIDGDLAKDEEYSNRNGQPYPPELDRTFFPMALAEERVIQLMRLTEAMDRFLRKVAETR